MIKKIACCFLLLMLSACQAVDQQTSKSHSLSEKGELQMTDALFQAVKEGDQEKIKNLIKGGVNINEIGDGGNTAVMVAAQAGNANIVRELIADGANIDLQNDRQDNVLLYASAEGLIDIVDIAIEAGADTTITNRFGGTALIPAADRGHVDIVRLLLEDSDVSVDHINHLHWTALLEAVILGDGGTAHQEIVELLLAHGADPSIADEQGITALEHARERGFTEMVRLLEQR